MQKNNAVLCSFPYVLQGIRPLSRRAWRWTSHVSDKGIGAKNALMKRGQRKMNLDQALRILIRRNQSRSASTTHTPSKFFITPEKARGSRVDKAFSIQGFSISPGLSL